jgi:hypothetical protein
MADATVAAGAAKTGIAGTALTAAKAAAISPIFGLAALGGIIAFEWWKGARDAREFTTAKSCPADTSK